MGQKKPVPCTRSERPSRSGNETSLSAKNVAQAFREFFTPEDVYRIDLADMFLARLRIVREFMATQTFLSLNSSSLLFLYDTETNKVDLRMVSLFFVFHLLLRSKFARAD